MTDPSTPIPHWTNPEGQPITYGELSAEIDRDAPVLTEFVTDLAAAWSADHDPAALAQGLVTLLTTLHRYSLPLVLTLVKADEVAEYIEAQAAAFSIPDDISQEV